MHKTSCSWELFNRFYLLLPAKSIFCFFLWFLLLSHLFGWSALFSPGVWHTLILLPSILHSFFELQWCSSVLLLPAFHQDVPGWAMIFWHWELLKLLFLPTFPLPLFLLYFYYCLHMPFTVLLAFGKNTVMTLVSCFSESPDLSILPQFPKAVNVAVQVKWGAKTSVLRNVCA